MNRIKVSAVRRKVFQGITVVELKGIVFLRFDVHADNVEASAVVSDCRATSATEQVK
jgi:hypothetical protein